MGSQRQQRDRVLGRTNTIHRGMELLRLPQKQVEMAWLSWPISVNQTNDLKQNRAFEVFVSVSEANTADKTLHWTGIPLRSIPAGELGRYLPIVMHRLQRKAFKTAVTP